MHHTCCSCACTVYHHTDWISYYWLFLFIGKQHPKLDDFKWKMNYFSIWIKMQKIFEVEINYTLIFFFTNWSIYKSIVIFPFFSWSKWMKAVLTCTACILTLYMYITLLGIDMLWNVPIWFLSAIFNAEFILSGVMRQTVDFKSYQIDVHWFKFVIRHTCKNSLLMSTASSVGFPSRIGIDVFTDQKGLWMKNPPPSPTHTQGECVIQKCLKNIVKEWPPLIKTKARQQNSPWIACTWCVSIFLEFISVVE